MKTIVLVKRASVMALATVVGCGIFGCQKKTEPIIPEVSVRVEETLDNDGDTIREVESVIGKESKSYIEESSVAKEEESSSKRYNIDGIDLDVLGDPMTEEEAMEWLKEVSGGKVAPLDYTNKVKEEFKKGKVIDLPESEWGPVYNADGSDPRVCPGGQVRAINAMNPEGKDGYILAGGVIVSKYYAELRPKSQGEYEAYDEIEMEVFKKNNPGINWVTSKNGWGSFPRWTYFGGPIWEENEIDHLEVATYSGHILDMTDEKIVRNSKIGQDWKIK